MKGASPGRGVMDRIMRQKREIALPTKQERGRHGNVSLTHPVYPQ
jgi:hypothetical protein